MEKLIVPKERPRVEPRLPEQVNPDMQVAYEKARIRWGIPDNLIRTMGCHPQLTLTEIDYINGIAFDTGEFKTIPDPRDPSKTVLFPASGFVDRVTKELCISFVSLINRSRYSVTHHTMIGYMTLSGLVEGKNPTQKTKRAEAMLLHLVDGQGNANFENQQYEGQPLYTPLQTACLRFAHQLARDERSISDQQVDELKGFFGKFAIEFIQQGPLSKQFDQNPPKEYVALFVDAMVVELSWCIVHFAGLLNKWFTFMRMRDEEFAIDETGETFIDAYNKTLPDSIKKRNNQILGEDGWGTLKNQPARKTA